VQVDNYFRLSFPGHSVRLLLRLLCSFVFSLSGITGKFVKNLLSVILETCKNVIWITSFNVFDESFVTMTK